MKKLKLSILAILAILIIAVLVSCGSLDNMAKYRKLQESVEYDARIKSNQAFTLESAKGTLKDVKEDAKEEKKAKADSVKVAKIRAKIEEVKNN